MPRSFFASLRVRLVLIVLLALLPAFGLALYGDLEQRRLATNAAQDNALRLARVAASNQSRAIETAHQRLIEIAHAPQIRQRDAAACNLLFADLLKQHPVYANLGAVDADGNVFCSGIPFQSPVNVADLTFFQFAVSRGDFAVGEYQVGRISQVPVLHVAMPVLDENSKLQGVVYASLSLKWVSALAAQMQLPFGSVINVVDRNGTILARFPDSGEWTGKSAHGTSLGEALNRQPGEGTVETIDLDGISRLYAFVPLVSAARLPDVYVSVGIPSAVAFSEADQSLTRNLIGLGLVAALALGAVWLFGEVFIVRRLSALSDVTEQLSAGNLSARTGPTYAHSELGKLERRLDEMAASLQQREATMHKWADIFQSTQVGLTICTPDGAALLLMNPAFAAMHGYAVDELVGRPLRDLVPPEDRAGMPDVLRAVAEKGHHILEYKGVRKDGTIFPGLIDATAVKDENGETLYVIASAQDISELRRAEAAEREQRALAEALHDTAAVLNSTHDFDELLERILDSVWRVVPHDAASIMLVESGVARVVGSRGYAERGLEPWLLALRFPISEHALLREILESGQPRLILDTREFPGWVDFPESHWIRSMIGMPIRVRERVIGFLNLDSSTPSFFNAAHVTRLETFADQAAIALENARLFAETGQRANQFSALYELAHDLATQRDLPTLLSSIVDRAVELLDAPCGYIYLYDDARNDLELAVEKGLNIPAGTRIQIGEGMAGRVIQSRQPLIVDNYSSWEHRSPIYEGVPYAATVQVPMAFGGDFIGVLGVSEIENKTRKFTEADAHLLALFAGQAASMVLNARLLAETERRASQFAALYEIERDLAAQHDLPTLLQTIGERAVSLLSGVAGGLFLFDAAQGELRLQWSKNLPKLLDTRLKLGEGMAGRVARTREPMIVDDYSAWEHRSPKYELARFTSAIQVPLLYGGELIGVLSVIGTPGRKFTDADTRLLSLLAGPAASAVHNARLLEETRTRAEQLAMLYDAGLTLNRVLDPRVQLEFLLKIATKALSADYAEFFRFDPASRQLSVELNIGYDDASVRASVSRLCFSIEDERGIVGSVASSRTPLHIGDVQQDPRWIAVDPKIRSGLWVPVQHEKQLRGVLAVLSTRLDAFTAQDERLLILFANQVATAMENARLFEAQRQRSAELEALRQASLHVTSTLDLPQVLEQIIEHALKLVSANNAHIFLYDGARLTFGAAMWADTRQREPFSEPRENGITYNVARAGARIVVPDVSRHPLFKDRPWPGAIASLPLKVGAQVRGVMNVAFTSPHAFDENELRVLELLADQATIALENARLMGETRRRAERLAVLYRVASAVHQTLNLDELLEVICEEVTAAFSADAFFIALYDAARGELDYRIQVDQGMREPPRRRPLTTGFGAHVIKTQKPLLIRNWELEKDRLPQPVLWGTMKPPKSWLGVPMRMGDAVVGLIGVESYTPDEYGEEEEQMLATIADQIAMVIQNARLFDETRRRAERLAVLNRISRAVSQTLESRELLEVIYREITAAMTVDAFFIALYDAAANELDYQIRVDEGVREPPVRLPVKTGLGERVIVSKKPLLIRDREREEQIAPSPQTLWGSMKPAVSWLGVPMLKSDAVVGIISVQSYSPNAYDEDEERLLVTIADQVSVAIQNARLFDETRQRLVELEAVNRVSTALRVAQTIDEMMPLLLDETLSVLSAPAGQIALYDAPLDEMRVVAARGWFDGTPRIAKATDGIAGLVFETGQPYVTREFKPDNQTSKLARAQIPEGWGGAIVPIRAAQEVIGVVEVSVKLPRLIRSGEVHLLTTLAEIAGSAIHRATLHEQTEQRLQRLDALHIIDTAIGASMDLRVTLNVLLDQVLTQLRVDAADILILNPRTQMLEYSAARGFRTNTIQHARVRMGQDHAGRAAIERRSTFISNIATARAFSNCPELIADEGFIAYHAVPLIAKGQVKGVLEVFHRSSIKPDPEWLDFLETLGGQAAIAIDNAGLFDGLQRSNFDMSLAYDATIEGWARSLDLRDQAPRGHASRVMQTTLRLARAMGMGDAELAHIRRGALLHDIGKMGIPDTILLKREPLTEEEEKNVRRHPTLAYELLSPISYLRPAIDIPYCHHENWDGTGYPRGLKGEQIPLAARIFAVVDAWERWRTDGASHAGLTNDQARQQLLQQSGARFDPKVVQVFLNLLDGDEA